MENSEEPQTNLEVRRRIRWYTYIGDFLNTLKAFIGSNYQSLPYAFAQSGLAFGLAGVFLIATLTDHCCQILVRCKSYIVEKIIKHELEEEKITESDVESLRERLELAVGYGDVAKQVFGAWCFRVTQAAVCFTQFMVCVAYFVFIANTVIQIFPTKPGNSSNETTLVKGQKSSGEEDVFDEMWSLEGKNGTGVCNVKTESIAPDPRLMYMVLFPLPILILTSLVRHVRYLAPMSSVATVALLVGAVAVLAYLIQGFHVGPFDWYKVCSLPVFLCQLIAAYEGIGCILPIQSSMVGCRHLFPAYLHANIYLIFVILCVFGSLGYLKYGDAVKQIIVLQIPQHTTPAYLVDIALIISVMFTYPLQCYPVIEIMETAILLPSQCCRKNTANDPEVSSETDPLLVRTLSIDSIDRAFSVSDVVATVVPSTVPAWKRNVIRVCITLAAAGLAIALRDNYFYVGAISGAVGSSFLAFILPCMIDIRLRYAEMSRLIMIKNITIIVVTIIVSISGLVMTIMKFAKGG